MTKGDKKWAQNFGTSLPYWCGLAPLQHSCRNIFLGHDPHLLNNFNQGTRMRWNAVVSVSHHNLSHLIYVWTQNFLIFRVDILSDFFFLTIKESRFGNTRKYGSALKRRSKEQNNTILPSSDKGQELCPRQRRRDTPGGVRERVLGRERWQRAVPQRLHSRASPPAQPIQFKPHFHFDKQN